MEKVEQFFKYIGYAVVSFFLGWLSYQANENDYINNVSSSIIPILLTLLVLYTSLSGFIFNELFKFKEKIKTEHEDSVDIGPTIKSMKRNVLIEISCIITCFLLLIVKGVLLNCCHNQDNVFFNVFMILSNAVIAFAVMYFIIVIYDSVEGLYELITENNKMK